MGAPSRFSPILSHPSRDQIIHRLVTGETASQVSDFVKFKYKGEKDKEITAKLLSEFREIYLDQYKFLGKVLEESDEYDPKIALSLMENDTWRVRLTKYVDAEVDLKSKLGRLLHMLEARTEQVFDWIQTGGNDARSQKADYVLAKYFELNMMLIEKYDRIANERPDQVIQHNVSVQLVEEHSALFQEAIREVLLEMDPETSALFMDKLSCKLQGLQPERLEGQHKMTIEKREQEANKLAARLEDEPGNGF